MTSQPTTAGAQRNRVSSRMRKIQSKRAEQKTAYSQALRVAHARLSDPAYVQRLRAAAPSVDSSKLRSS